MSIFRKKSTADDALSVMGPTAKLVSEKWKYFVRTVPFKEDVPLAYRITTFSVPAMQGMRENVQELRDAPDAVLLMVVMAGVKLAGTHSLDEIVAAMTPPGQNSGNFRAALEALPN